MRIPVTPTVTTAAERAAIRRQRVVVRSIFLTLMAVVTLWAVIAGALKQTRKADERAGATAATSMAAGRAGDGVGGRGDGGGSDKAGGDGSGGTGSGASPAATPADPAALRSAGGASVTDATPAEGRSAASTGSGSALPDAAGPAATPDPVAAKAASACGAGPAAAAALGLPGLPATTAGDDAARRGAAKLAAALDRAEGDAPRAVALFLAGDAEALARRAAAASDPLVWTLAFHACRTASWAVPSVPACRPVTAAGWARADATNAAPWRHVAEDAVGAGDAAMLADAVGRIARARRMDDGRSAAFGALQAWWPAGLTAAEDAALVARLAALARAVPPAPWAAVLSHCQAAVRERTPAPTPARPATTAATDAGRPGPATAEPDDAPRRRTCDAAADVLFERGTTLADQHAALAIGAGAWTAEKRVAKTLLLDAAREALAAEREATSSVAASGASAGCDAQAAAFADRLRRETLRGDAAAARDAIGRSGLAAAELARRWKARQAAALAGAVVPGGGGR